MSALTVAGIVRVTGLLLVAGAALVLALFLVPSKRAAAREIFAAMLSMLVVAGTILAVFWFGTATLLAFMALLAARAGYEAGAVLLGRQRGLAVGAGAAILAALAMGQPLAAPAYAGLWLLLFARQLLRPGRTDGVPGTLAQLLLYPLLPLAVLAHAVLDPELRPLMLAIYVLVELFDSGAYAIGKLVGRRPAFPVLSPRKTVEGLIGGAVCLMAIAAGIAAAAGLSVPGAVLLALLSGLFGVAGDLGASRLKRRAGVKDFPVVLKRQGGALDVFDSWISAGAAIAVLILLRGLL